METQTRQTVAVTDGWPNCLAVAQVRVARPTDQLAEIETFYSTDLGLPVLYRFENHAGYDGVMVGLCRRVSSSSLSLESVFVPVGQPAVERGGR